MLACMGVNILHSVFRKLIFWMAGSIQTLMQNKAMVHFLFYYYRSITHGYRTTRTLTPTRCTTATTLLPPSHRPAPTSPSFSTTLPGPPATHSRLVLSTTPRQILFTHQRPRGYVASLTQQDIHQPRRHKQGGNKHQRTAPIHACDTKQRR